MWQFHDACQRVARNYFEERAALAARLFSLVQSIRFLIRGVVADIVDAKAPYC